MLTTYSCLPLVVPSSSSAVALAMTEASKPQHPLAPSTIWSQATPQSPTDIQHVSDYKNTYRSPLFLKVTNHRTSCRSTTITTAARSSALHRNITPTFELHRLTKSGAIRLHRRNGQSRMQDTMDIRKWLDEIVQPETPREPVRHRKNAEPTKRKRRRKSDSSILDPRPLTSPPHESVDDCTGEALQATCSDSSRNSSRYARKPRRKTRPERYEPAPHARRDPKGESKRARRKPRRKKGEKLPAVIPTLQAKNVSGDRLTLKPREQLGLFNKGRTSTAVRGRGLPDLVFSEMKFLQKQRDEPESVARPDLAKKKRKRDQEQTKEGEISAFFNSVHPVSVEKESNRLPQHAAPRSERRRRDQSPVHEIATPIVEVADPASYLGFGSRGRRHDSTSYVSWSESIRAISTTPAQPCSPPTRHSPHGANVYSESDPRKGRENEAFKLPARPLSAKKRGTDSTPANRFTISSLTLSHNRTSRSQSFPQRSSSPRRPNLVNRSAKLQEADTACSPSAMPPFARASIIDVCHARTRSNSKGTRPGAAPASSPVHAVYQHHNQPNEDSVVEQNRITTSSDLGLALQRCNDTFYQRRHVTGPRRRHTEQIHPACPRSNLRQDAAEFCSTAQRAPAVRFADQFYHGSTLPSFAGPGIYEQQALQQQLPLHLEIDGGHLQPPYIDQAYLEQDDPIAYDDHAWEGLREEPISYDFEGSMDAYEDCQDRIGLMEEPVRDLRQVHDTVAPGFWRPNKLY